MLNRICQPVFLNIKRSSNGGFATKHSQFLIFSAEQIVPSTLNSLIRAKVLLQFNVCCWIHFAIHTRTTTLSSMHTLNSLKYGHINRFGKYQRIFHSILTNNVFYYLDSIDVSETNSKTIAFTLAMGNQMVFYNRMHWRLAFKEIFVGYLFAYDEKIFNTKISMEACRNKIKTASHQEKFKV